MKMKELLIHYVTCFKQTLKLQQEPVNSVLDSPQDSVELLQIL